MTSRPSLGVQQRQPQRSLSGSGIPQRPPHQRTLSQQYLPPSPIRKEAFSDFNTPDAGDVAQGRMGSLRRGGSRLKLELSHETSDQTLITESPGALESSRAFTPSRIMPASEPSELGDMSPQPSTQGDAESSRLPMPKRRPRFAQAPNRPAAPKATPAPPAKKDTRPKIWTVEVPADAPRFSKRGKVDPRSKIGATAPGSSADTSLTGSADFFPWSGGHAEDQWSEQIIRSGYFDKPPASGTTETSSAKAALFPMLKHKTGLHMLSSIFTGVLGQRRHSGQINPTSTFKPPPRVTVTDSKREGWLKDLATPTIPIRRLSRTIPHGIRGKVLLEQCLNKEIPTDRAVWLAKNVGANELRAFRRKGVNGAFVMGGETKWFKDWTGSVEQFLETRISAFTEDDWKAKVNYAIRLATNLYAEHLLDRDHYMDWLVSSLENSTQAKLPMWILLVQLYLKDILSLRKHGRRLVTALLSHHAAVQSNPDKDILQPLTSTLSSLVNKILKNSPHNFVCPSMWPKYRDSVESSLTPDDARVHSAFKHVNNRNEQVAVDSVRTNPAARNVLVKLLDSTLQSPFSNELAAQCWSVSRDKNALVRTVLDWCTSLYRSGMAKVYVAARLLTTWNNHGVDVTTAILGFMGSEKPAEPQRKKIVYHLVSELVRSGNFSISRYVEWLIARGGLHSPDDVDPEAPVDTRLLIELPVHSMSESLRTLRASMLRRAFYVVDDESQDFAMAIDAIQACIGFPLGHDVPMNGRKPMSVGKLSKRIGKSSRALKTEVASWLRDAAVRMDVASKGEKEGLGISVSLFAAIRSMLEAAEDYSMLAQVLEVASGMSDVELLASCADTVSLHLEVFAALGKAQELFASLLARLKALVEGQGLAARPLLAALASLAPRLPGHEELGTQLHNDLVRSDRSTMVDACSPVSDNMALRLQDAESELHEEIEKLLMNGTSMDRNTMERLFGTVIERLQGCWAKVDDERQRAYALLLTRLRLFDVHHFDNLMSKWLCMVRTSVERPPLLHIFPLLVSTGCLGLPLILASASDRIPANSALNRAPTSSIVQSTWKTRYVQGVLQLLGQPLSHHPMLSDEECYRYSVVQSQTGKTHLKELLVLFRTALAEYSLCKQHGGTGLPLDEPQTLNRLLEHLKTLAVMDSTSVSQALTARSADPAVAAYLEQLTTKLLIPNCSEGEHISFEKVLELTNEFTLPFCQLKLVASLGSGDARNADTADGVQSHLEMFAKAMDNAIEARNITWTGMLSCLSPEITQHLKNRAQARFFDVIPSMKNPLPPERTLEQSVQMAENLLSVIDAVVREGTMGRPPQLIAAMADKLADMWEILSTGDLASKKAVVKHWLPLLLTFTTLHTTTFDTSKVSNEIRGRILLIFSGILQDLDILPPDAGLDHQLKERVFDLGLVLVDNLADDTRQQCVRILRDSTSDQRAQYIFSFASPPWEHLMLSHRDRPGTVASTAAAANNNGGQGQTPAPPTPAPPRYMGMGVWSQQQPERLSKFVYRQWDVISDPNPNVGENDSSLNLSLFEAIKLQ